MNNLNHAYGVVTDKACLIQGDTMPKDVVWEGMSSFVQSDNGETLTIISWDLKYHALIKKEGFRVYGFPSFSIGDTVITKEGEKSGVVYLVSWHKKRQSFLYCLDFSSHRSTRWWFEDELKKGQ
jgi:hypothetical protein